jgi:choline-sulfatase
VTASQFTTAEWGLGNGHDQVEKIEDSSVELTDRALEMLQAQDPEQPWFHHIHYAGPHSPYDPPEEYGALLDPDACPFPLETRGDTWSLLVDEFENLTPDQQAGCVQQVDLRYDSEIHHDDAQIGRILDWLETGPGEDTLVVFFTDHGEAFNEHLGNTSHGWFHSSSHYDEMVGTMLAFYNPGNLQPARVEKATSLLDLVPSTLALLGLETERVFTGRVVDLESEVLTFQLGYRKSHTSHTVSTTTDKLHFHASCQEGRLRPWGPMEYYDLQSDPGETQNLYDPAHPRVQALWAALQPKIVELMEREPDYTPTCSY